MFEYDEKPTMFEEESLEFGQQTQEQRVALYVAKVMGWMCVGLLTTFVSCLLSLSTPWLFYLLRNFGSTGMYGIMVAQLVVVLVMSASANRISAGTATVLFMLYAALTGITFATLAFVFQTASILFVFALTALIFVAMAIYGFVTKKDLTRIGSLALFGLLGIIIAGVVNIFLGSDMLTFAITAIGIVLFIALTAYDTQKIKNIYTSAIAQGYDEDSQQVRKLAIFGALTLYLDFINLFLKLLRLLGKKRN